MKEAASVSLCNQEGVVTSKNSLKASGHNNGV